MNIRQTNLALQLATLSLATGALVCLAVGLVLPMSLANPSSATVALTAKKTAAVKLPAVASFMPLFARSVQGSAGAGAVAETSATEVQSTNPSTASPPVVLVGTIGNSDALLRFPNGMIAVAEPGDDIDGTPVVAIRPNECDLRINGKITTLRMPPAPVYDVIVPSK